jgi:hypothetical protein
MTLLTTDVVAIIIALVGLMTITVVGLNKCRQLEIQNRNLRKENSEMKWNSIKI